MSTDGVTKITAPVFTGTAEAGATVTVYDGVTAIGTGVATGGTYAIQSSTLTAATHTVTAKAIDLAGNTSPASASATIVVDTTAPAAPAAPTLSAASDSGTSSIDRITNDTTPTYTGTSAQVGGVVTLFEGAVTLGSGSVTAGAWSATSTVLADGTHTITAKVADLAGNLSAASPAAPILTIDTVAPTTPSTPALAAASDTGSSNTDGITTDTTPTYTGTRQAQSIVTLLANGTVVGTANAGATTTWSINSSVLANGTYAITAFARDAAGNASATSAAAALTVDTVAPTTTPSVPTLTVASDTGISATDRITRLSTPALTGTAAAGDTIVLFDGAPQVGTGAATGGTYLITTSALTNGVHNLTARATDVAGNLSTASAATAVTVDLYSPTVTIKKPIGQPNPMTTSPVPYDVLFNEVVYGFIGADVTLTGTAGATTTTISGAGPSYTASVSGMLRAGTIISNILAAVVTDAAGNNNLVTTSPALQRTINYAP